MNFDKFEGDRRPGLQMKALGEVGYWWSFQEALQPQSLEIKND